MRRSRRLSFLATGFGCALSGFAVWAAIDSLVPEPDATAPRYLVSKRSLSKGLPLALPDLALRSLSKDERCASALTDQDLDLLPGAVLREDVAASAPICATNLNFSEGRSGSSQIPRGYRGFVFRPLNRLPLRSNNVIDIFIHPASESEMPYLGASGIRVLQVLRNASSRGLSELLVAVPLARVAALEKAAERGKLSVALRNPSDESEIPNPGSSKRNHYKKPPRGTVEIISEGE